jgi:hypothetical protein
MTIAGATTTIICFAFLFIPVIVSVAWLVKLKRSYMRYTLYLRAQGIYIEWARKKKVLISIIQVNAESLTTEKPKTAVFCMEFC